MLHMASLNRTATWKRQNCQRTCDCGSSQSAEARQIPAKPAPQGSRTWLPRKAEASGECAGLEKRQEHGRGHPPLSRATVQALRVVKVALRSRRHWRQPRPPSVARQRGQRLSVGGAPPRPSSMLQRPQRRSCRRTMGGAGLRFHVIAARSAFVPCPWLKPNSSHLALQQPARPRGTTGSRCRSGASLTTTDSSRPTIMSGLSWEHRRQRLAVIRRRPRMRFPPRRHWQGYVRPGATRRQQSLARNGVR
mmetsp:Transcript_54972/g.159132  ORF Transcript_54972/g.159132 Transcript_54972/m.159132 type:complete len:249 (+) Transcript_54972:564-1310(+)